MPWIEPADAVLGLRGPALAILTGPVQLPALPSLVCRASAPAMDPTEAVDAAEKRFFLQESWGLRVSHWSPRVGRLFLKFGEGHHVHVNVVFN